MVVISPWLVALSSIDTNGMVVHTQCHTQSKVLKTVFLKHKAVRRRGSHVSSHITE